MCFKKFINAGKFYSADLLILGGDITGKAMVPIAKEAEDRYRLHFLGADRVVDANGLKEVEESIRFNGYYPYVCEPDEVETLMNSPKDVRHAFTSVMREQAESWTALADKRLEGTGIRCLIMPGNDDEPFLEDVLSRSTTVENHDGTVIEVGGYLVAGYGWSNPTPWDTPREKPENDIESDLRALLAAVSDPTRLVFNAHVPPYNSGLDLAPELRPDFSMVTNGGQPHMIPVGSTAVRQVVEAFQPMLVLSGHIHESRGITDVGGSVAINPGSEYNVGRLLGALVDLEGGAVKRKQLVVG
ncbi:MAG: metallophosphoesterase family protein [Actinomycetota bacterium]